MHRHRYNIAGCIYVYTYTHAHVYAHRDISMLSGDIIERRIQMNPELLGFPCSTRSPTLSLSLSLRFGSSPRRPLYPSQSSPGTSPSFPAAGAFLWPFDAPPLRSSPYTRCLEERCKAIDRFDQMSSAFDRDDCHPKSQWAASLLLFHPFSSHLSASFLFQTCKSNCGGGNSRREYVLGEDGPFSFFSTTARQTQTPTSPRLVNILEAAPIPGRKWSVFNQSRLSDFFPPT